MEELTEVITAAEFHPTACHLFVYSSSKGTIRLCDMRTQAICDKHTKRELKSRRFYRIIGWCCRLLLAVVFHVFRSCKDLEDKSEDY